VFSVSRLVDGWSSATPPLAGGARRRPPRTEKLPFHRWQDVSKTLPRSRSPGRAAAFRDVDAVLTVSIGVAAGDDDANTLLARADGALYNAKRAGRNCSLAATDTDSDLPVGTGRRRERLEEPVPRHLRSMLAVSRAAASGGGPIPVLETLAETLRSELSFHVVAVRLLDADRRELTCMIVLGDDDARQVLLGTVSPWSEWEQLLLPLRGQSGEVLGLVSVDQPASGRRPDDGQIAFLMSVADHAGLRDIATWVRGHHERIDGCGYPDQLRAEEIALEARILAVADAYEAMIADRPYRSGMSIAEARSELERCTGTQFDPEVVRAFLRTVSDGDDAPLMDAVAGAV
jgi:hypothetical protein